jgi:hypothetical protein
MKKKKNSYREILINDFLKQKEKKASILASNPNELERIKRTLISEYANRLNQRCVVNSYRSQLIILYYSISKLLEYFPNTRDGYFISLIIYLFDYFIIFINLLNNQD